MQTKQRRWMASVIAAAKTDTPAMPWARGHRRAIAARRAGAAVARPARKAA